MPHRGPPDRDTGRCACDSILGEACRKIKWAARRLHLSQPAATHQIRQLERDLEALAGVETGEVRLGGGSTAVVQLLPRLIEGFRESHPKVSFYVREGSTAKMASAVASGDLDLAIAMLPCDHPDLACERWFEEPIVVVARPGAQLAGQQAFGTVGIAPRVVMELESIEGIKAHVEAGLGYSALGFHSVERKLAGGQLVALAIRGLEIRRAMGLIYRRHAELSPAVSAFRTALLGLRPRNP